MTESFSIASKMNISKSVMYKEYLVNDYLSTWQYWKLLPDCITTIDFLSNINRSFFLMADWKFNSKKAILIFKCTKIMHSKYSIQKTNPKKSLLLHTKTASFFYINKVYFFRIFIKHILHIFQTMGNYTYYLPYLRWKKVWL